jgi:hypothetical protein
MPRSESPTAGAVRRSELSNRMSEIAAEVWDRVRTSRGVVIVESPPGAGKTKTLISIATHAVRARKSVGIIAQTNAQADDICRRIAEQRLGKPLYRFIGKGKQMDSPVMGCIPVESADEVADGPRIVVGVTAKWSLVDQVPWIDLALVDESWQMAMVNFIPLLRHCDRFVLIGDPGQIAPVIQIETEKWDVSRAPPHRAAPEVLLETMDLEAIQLPATWRLPEETARLVQSFYDFSFESAAMAGERALKFAPRGKSQTPDAVDSALETLQQRSLSSVLIPMPSRGVPAMDDPEVSSECVKVVTRALDRKAIAFSLDRGDDTGEELRPEDIGIATTHKVLMQRIDGMLQTAGINGIKVDTAERWQGLERKLMVVVHPLSSTPDPDFEFDLGTGRLCVMASRHQHGMVVVTRDHVRSTLAGLMPPASQPLGRPDEASRSLQAHRMFMRYLDEARGSTT